MSDLPGGQNGPKIPGLPLQEQTAAEAVGESGTQAWLEAEQLSGDKSAEALAEEAANAEHGRNQRFRDQFERLAICALWLTAVAITGIGGVWVWHLIMPQCYRWLSIEELSHLQSIVTAGLLVGVVGNHFKKRLG